MFDMFGERLSRQMRVLGGLAALVAVLVAASSACASGRGRPAAYPDTFVTRLEALALIQTLNANILSSTSATTTLERWCRDHELAAPPRITATRVQGVERPATLEQRARLGVSEHETVMHRHVQLRCGDRVLSEAVRLRVRGPVFCTRLAIELQARSRHSQRDFRRVSRLVASVPRIPC